MLNVQKKTLQQISRQKLQFLKKKLQKIAQQQNINKNENKKQEIQQKGPRNVIQQHHKETAVQQKEKKQSITEVRTQNKPRREYQDKYEIQKFIDEDLCPNFQLQLQRQKKEVQSNVKYSFPRQINSIQQAKKQTKGLQLSKQLTSICQDRQEKGHYDVETSDNNQLDACNTDNILQKEIQHPLYNKYKQTLQQSDATIQNRLLRFGSSIARLEDSLKMNKNALLTERQPARHEKSSSYESKQGLPSQKTKQIHFNKNNYHYSRNLEEKSRKKQSDNYKTNSYSKDQDYNRQKRHDNGHNYNKNSNSSKNNTHNAHTKYTNSDYKRKRQQKDESYRDNSQYKQHKFQEKYYRQGCQSKEHQNYDNYHRSRDQKYYKHKYQTNNHQRSNEKGHEYERIKPNTNFLKRYIRPYPSNQQQNRNNRHS